MPKLLDVIKTKGLTHQDVLDLIEKADLPEAQEEELDTPDEEVLEDDKPDDDRALYITKLEPEVEEEEIEEQSETISLTPEELAIKIKEGVEEKLKANRKVPSKGKIVGKPQADVPVVKKNWYEQIV